MSEVKKRPQVIRDLLEIATYLAADNLNVSDRFLVAAEATFNKIGKMPEIGKTCQFSHPQLANIRQQPIKGFKNYLIFYRFAASEIEILRVIHGARDIPTMLDDVVEDE
ncbi:type II toxin-antitoxin system RelE/ParE family toxin [Aliterella atlantica]|uniref:Plasmid stabilization system n=1 Tax=Aliterella atlantica CENA595 TaxID=1618023 RepID=A0A0D8ZTB6_9CYAN|nr:type II toxin-antitoxin system RelE/ParE family toxin [Aliterella atlantica]KJH71694.1 plasmid stabilization system [Aliterella atlantica CENA595]